MYNVASFRSLLNRGGLEVGEVLARERENGWRLLAGQRREIRGRRLIAVRGTPEVKVRHCAEVGGGLDRLMRRTVLTKAD